MTGELQSRKRSPNPPLAIQQQCFGVPWSLKSTYNRLTHTHCEMQRSHPPSQKAFSSLRQTHPVPLAILEGDTPLSASPTQYTEDISTVSRDLFCNRRAFSQNLVEQKAHTGCYHSLLITSTPLPPPFTATQVPPQLLGLACSEARAALLPQSHWPPVVGVTEC